MPYSFPDRIPAVAKNWTEKEQRACVLAANAALIRGGGTAERDAIFACIHAAGKGRNDQGLVPAIVAQMQRRARARGAKFRLKRPPTPRSIKSLIRQYLKEIEPMLYAMREAVAEYVTPVIDPVLQRALALRPQPERADDFIDDIERAMSVARVQFLRRYSEREIEVLARRAAGRVETFNAREFDRTFGAVLNVQLGRTEPWLAEEIKAFTRQNVELISSIPEQYFGRVQQQIMQGVQAGTPTSSIAEAINAAYDVGENRAALIARDQTSKFNGNLNRLRQQEVGVTKYIWSTSLDERVRPEHAEREGEVFSWDDPPEDGHPGQPINCVPEHAIVSLRAPAVKAFRRWYDGELTELVTDADEPLQTTPNHPVLTLRGWIPAHLIEVGDHLVEAPTQDGDVWIADPQGRDADAQEIFRTLSSRGISHRVARGAPGFHGDSAGEDVYVVELNRGLKLAANASRAQRLGDDQFALSPQPSARHRHAPLGLVAFDGAAHGIVSRPGHSGALLGRGVCHAEEHGRASIADGNAAVDQYATNWGSADPNLLGDGLLAHSVLVKPDDFRFRKVKAVVRKPWSGWVHNFETITGWFVSGNLIVHNCRCVAIPVIDAPEEE